MIDPKELATIHPYPLKLAWSLAWEEAHLGANGRAFRVGDRVIHRIGQGRGRPPKYLLGTVQPSEPGESPGKWTGRLGPLYVLFDGEERARQVRTSRERTTLKRLGAEPEIPLRGLWRTGFPDPAGDVLAQRDRAAWMEARPMTRDDIKRIMDEVPGLNAQGVGVSNFVSPEERERDLAQGKEALLDSIEECNKICGWLEEIEKIKAINGNRSSYGLKQIAQRDIGDISHGAFIVAAIYSGFPYRLDPKSISVTFAMSERSIMEVVCRQNKQGKAH